MISQRKIVFVCIIGSLASALVCMGASNPTGSPCMREMSNANLTLFNLADNLEDMMNDSSLPSNSLPNLRNEADRVIDLIGDFGDNLSKKSVDSLAKDLVDIRKAANRLALDVYLQNFDMKWPTMSMQILVTIERVQQACASETASKVVLKFKR